MKKKNDTEKYFTMERFKEMPMLKFMQPLYEDVYIKWVNKIGLVSEIVSIMPFKEAKIQYGDELVYGFENCPDALVTIMYLSKKEKN